MKVYCLVEFKNQFEKLKKNNSYKDLEKDIISNFFGKNTKDFFGNGARLNGTNDAPFIKKRIAGSSGWRFYYLLLIKDDRIYLMYLHPKTGSDGASTTTKEYEKSLYNEVLSCIKSNDLYTVTVSGNKLKFKHNLIKDADKKNMEELVEPIEAAIEQDKEPPVNRLK